MQVRKRAKSVSFGKPNKEKEEKKVVKPLVEKPVDTKAEPTFAAKKVEDYPTFSSTDDSQNESEKSSESIIKDPIAPETATPSNEFVTNSADSSSSLAPISPPISEPEETPKDEKKITPQMVVEPVASSPAEQAPEAATESNELSATPPTSAFTLQGNNIEVSNTGGSSKKHVIFYFLLIAFISFMLGLVAMAAVNYFGLLPKNITQLPIKNTLLENIKKSNPTPTSSLSNVPTVAPTATPTAKPMDLKSFKVSVLNGSGVKGKAAEVKASLTEAGFNVESSGNADRSDYTATQIVAKKSVSKEFIDALSKELSSQFTLDDVSTIPADSTQTADVIVTLGPGKLLY